MIFPKTLSEKHFEFLNKEFDINITSLNDLDGLDDGLHDEIFEKLCDIEVEETCKSGENELSERGILASDVVTFMGGPFEPDEDWIGDNSKNQSDDIDSQIAL